jgi:hypothetical protein
MASPTQMTLRLTRAAGLNGRQQPNNGWNSAPQMVMTSASVPTWL